MRQVLSLSLPTVLLGGGGYDSRSAAILWTRLTAAAAGVRLDTEEVRNNQSGSNFDTRRTRLIDRFQ